MRGEGHLAKRLFPMLGRSARPSPLAPLPEGEGRLLGQPLGNGLTPNRRVVQCNT